MIRLTIIKEEKQVDELIKHCKTTGYCSFDFETTSLKYYLPEEYPLILGISFQPGSAWIIPLGHKDSPFKKKYVRIFIKFAKEVLENKDIIKIAWNLKFEYKWCMKYGIFLKGKLFDSMLAKYCLDEEIPHSLKDFVRRFFPDLAGYENKIKDEDKVLDWKNKPYPELCEYCGIDAETTLRGMIIMEPKLWKQKFYSMFRNMFMMGTRVLAEAEFRGILIDRPYLKDLMVKYAGKIRDAEDALKSDPALLKYEKKYKIAYLEELVNKVRLDIAEIANRHTPNAARLIANRELKIKGFFEGKFNNKEKWEPMNFGSPKQVRHFFFESSFGLKLKPFKYTKDSKSGEESDTPSTDEESLKALEPKDKTGFMKKLLSLRELQKLNGTYIEGMFKHLDPWNRVHAGFKINGTVTGRLSCKDPNLQNIPRGTTAADIKRMFIPPKGFLQWEIDYSQAELRIIAEVAEDKAMIDIFKRNYNIHVATACKMKGKLDRYDKIKEIIKIGEGLGGKELEKKENKKFLFWVKQKKKGKSLNFSIVYQQGTDATAETLECTRQEAKKFTEDWFKAFPQVKKWIDKQKKLAHNQEYVRNIFGTKRRLKDANCGVKWKEAQAERQAVNAPIQGGSGYFTFFSMVIMRQKIIEGVLPRDMFIGYTVHDSIGGYIRPQDIHETMPKLIEICNNPETQKYFGFELKHVRMKVSPEIGRHWEGLKDYDPNEDYSKWLN